MIASEVTGRSGPAADPVDRGRHSGGEMFAGDITGVFSQPTVSHHLKALKDLAAGLRAARLLGLLPSGPQI
jgi:DNA-binding transcriptional ArsR family regulator